MAPSGRPRCFLHSKQQPKPSCCSLAVGGMGASVCRSRRRALGHTCPISHTSRSVRRGGAYPRGYKRSEGDGPRRTSIRTIREGPDSDGNCPGRSCRPTYPTSASRSSRFPHTPDRLGSLGILVRSRVGISCLVGLLFLSTCG